MLEDTLPTSSLAFVVRSDWAAAIIGARGAMVKSIKSATGVHSIHLSSHRPGAGVSDRAVAITGPPPSILSAFDRVDAVVRGESGLDASAVASVRLLVPDARSIHGHAATDAIRTASGAHVEVSAPPAALDVGKQRLLTCSGTAAQVRIAVETTMRLTADRHAARHKDFYAQWTFETAYSDHFETPKEAYEDVAPVLRSIAVAQHGGQRRDADAEAHALRELTVYDPYYCQGRMRECLAEATGCSPSRVINENVDFYSATTHGSLPEHDTLVTNPPYSGTHKQRLLEYLLQQQQQQRRRRPFLLLVPAWMAATDYWSDFLKASAAARAGDAQHTQTAASAKEKGAHRKRPSKKHLERRAGVFYVCPRARYSFTHPEKTGHAQSPFHAVWLCGGWRTDKERKRAQRALRPARRSGRLEVFRKGRMLRKRGALVEAHPAHAHG